MPGNFRFRIAVILANIACNYSVTIPADAQISCGSASECPPGYVCKLGACRGAETIDTKPPDLAAAPEVFPMVGRSGATFTVKLKSNEELLEPPRVTLGLDPPVRLGCNAAGENIYRCTYRASGKENGGLGGVVGFDVWMKDRSRNETVRNLAGALHFDFSAPTLAAASFTPAPVPLGGVLQLFFTVSEPLSANPVLVASAPLDDDSGGATHFTLEPQPDTLNYAFAHSVSALDPFGDLSFTLEMTDLAGNSAIVPAGAVI